MDMEERRIIAEEAQRLEKREQEVALGSALGIYDCSPSALQLALDVLGKISATDRLTRELMAEIAPWTSDCSSLYYWEGEVKSQIVSPTTAMMRIIFSSPVNRDITIKRAQRLRDNIGGRGIIIHIQSEIRTTFPAGKDCHEADSLG